MPREQTGPAAILVIGLIAFCGCSDPVVVRDHWSVFDRTAEVEVHMGTERDAEWVLQEMRSVMQRVALELDPHGDSGELGRLNRSGREAFYRVENADVYRLLLLALDYARASRGAYDPTVGPLLRLYEEADGVPTDDEIERILERVGWADVTQAPEARAFRFRRDGMALALGPVAHGFALDSATRAFSRIGSRGGRLQLGHQIYVWGVPATGRDWEVALSDPRNPDRPLLSLQVNNRGVSISGRQAGDARMPLDPRSGRPAESDVIVAVALAHSAADAAAMSSALLVAGSKEGSRLLDKTRQLEVVLLVEGRGSPYLLASASLKGRLEPSAELLTEVGGQLRYLLPPQRMIDPSEPFSP